MSNYDPYGILGKDTPIQNTISRSATFEHLNPEDNFVRVLSESGFFSSPYIHQDSIVSTIPHIGSIVYFWYLKTYIDDCVNEGANINVDLHKDEIRQLFWKVVDFEDLKYVPQLIIASLPEVKIKEDHIASNKADCIICTEDFMVNEEAKQLPCNHLYHKNCIARWLEERKSCPVCRQELKVYDLSYDKMVDAWNRMHSIATSSGEKNTVQPSSKSIIFKIELVWPVESMFSRLKISSTTNAEGSGEA